MGSKGLVAELLERQQEKRRIRAKVIEVLGRSDWNEILELAGGPEGAKEAGTAMKAVMAERITEYTVRAMKEARKRGTRLGAAAVIIAASKAK
ncbi:MAG: hypothetical protein ACREBH_01265 [Candidatus Micrarchaeaceae archaeon]